MYQLQQEKLRNLGAALTRDLVCSHIPMLLCDLSCFGIDRGYSGCSICIVPCHANCADGIQWECLVVEHVLPRVKGRIDIEVIEMISSAHSFERKPRLGPKGGCARLYREYVRMIIHSDQFCL